MSDDNRRITSMLDFVEGPNTQQTINELQEIRSELTAIGIAGNDASKSGGGIGSIGKGSRTAATGVRNLSSAVNILGGETSDAVNSVGAILPLLPLVATGIDGMTASAAALNIVFPPFIAIAAAVAAIVGTVTIGVSLYNDSVKEQEEAVNAAKDATIAYNEALSQTSDEIEIEIELNNELLATNLANQKATQDAIDALDEPNNILFDMADGLGLVGDAGDELSDELKDLQEQEDDLTNTTEGLTKAYESQEVAANDARQALLADVDQLAETRKFEQEALAGSAEQNAARAESIREEAAIVREQIAVLEASGDTSKEVTDEISSLNSELGNLGKQSNILSSAAVKAAEAQKAQSAASDELSKVTEQSAKVAQAAAQKTSAAKANEAKVIKDSFAASSKASKETAKLAADQAQEIAELRQDEHKRRIKDEKDFNKSIDELVKNQSFLKAIDRQDDYVDEEQEQRNAAQEGLAELRVELAQERAEKDMARKAEQADRFASIVEAQALTRKAEREELRLQRVAQNDVLRLQESKAKQEVRLQEQVNRNLVTMLSSVVKYAGDAANQVDSILSKAGGNAANGKSSGGIRNIHDISRMLGEVIG